MTELFSPFDLAGLTLGNRIVMAPMGRARAYADVPTPTSALYYTQRATAGLIITESAPISPQAKGNLYAPCLFSAEQIAGWKLVTESVHAAGGKIFAQIWHAGRVSHSSLQPGNASPVSSSAIRAIGAPTFAFREDGTPGLVDASEPKALSTDEVELIIQDFVSAAVNAIDAGFDGVEVHAANGYLIEQFLNPKINIRTDRYTGTTIEGRIRFALEVVDAVAERIGKQRTGIRLSPYGQVFDTPLYDEIDETYSALVEALAKREIAYVHLKDHTRVDLGRASAQAPSEKFDALRAKLRLLLPRTTMILAGNLTGERAAHLVENGEVDLVAFGRPFISNPDLVARLQHGWPLTPADPDVFYEGGAKGYIDYPPFLSAMVEP